jgi:L-threonylcarbamoyladenylate synthase
MPNHPHLLEIIKKVGPIYSSSANISNQKPVIDHIDAQIVFGNNFTYELILVKGKQRSDSASTIIDFDRKFELRSGSIKSNDIIQALEGK